MKTWLHILFLTFTALNASAMEVEGSRVELSDDILPFTFAQDAHIGHPYLLQSYDSLFTRSSISQMVYQREEWDIAQAFGKSFIVEEIDRHEARDDLAYPFSSGSLEADFGFYDDRALMEIDERARNIEDARERTRLGRSKSPIFDAFIACVLNRNGAHFSNQLTGRIWIADFNQVLRCIDDESSKPTPTREKPNRIKALAKWFDGFYGARQNAFAVVAWDPQKFAQGVSRVQAILASRSKKPIIADEDKFIVVKKRKNG